MNFKNTIAVGIVMSTAFIVNAETPRWIVKPAISPDGKNIAFTGQYDGNTEVFLIPANGGEPVRLTYTATNSRDDIGDRMGPNNIVMTWSPDGKNIVYRNRINISFD